MFLKDDQRPTRAEIDLDALAYNVRTAREFLGQDVSVMAVIKANAYGHGAVQCGRRLEKEGVKWLAVAIPEEGSALREAGIRSEVLVLGGFWQGQAEMILRYRLTPVVYQARQAEWLNAAAVVRGEIAPVHVKVDTGMGRLGLRPEEISAFIEALSRCTHVRLEGLMTHFAAADDPAQDDFTRAQAARFKEAATAFRAAGFDPPAIHLANSPAAVAHPDFRERLIRLGGIIYGLGGDVLPAGVPHPDLRAVMGLKTAVAHLKRVRKGETLSYGRTFAAERDSVIASIPIGYHDGYFRRLSNKGRAIVRGHYAPIVGRISMDWTLLDVTDVAEVTLDDEVVLIGRQSNAGILAEDVAAWAGTISYEVTCSVDRRVPRIFLPE